MFVAEFCTGDLFATELFTNGFFVAELSKR